MRTLFLGAALLMLSAACHGQALVSTCQHDSGFGTFVVTNTVSCTVAAGELLVGYASVCGSACLATIPATPNMTFSGGGLTWTSIESIADSFNNNPCSFSANPRCVISTTMFWAYTGATAGTFTFTQGSSASAELQITILRFSGTSATPFDQATLTETTTPGGATTITDGTLTLLSTTATGKIDLTGGTAGNSVSIAFLGFHGSGATELLVITGSSANASVAATQTGYTSTLLSVTAGCGCDFTGYKVVTNIAAAGLAKGWVF